MRLVERFLKGDERALARAITWIEAGLPEGQDFLTHLRQRQGKAHIIGITGSPGSGKSTLADQLIAQSRSRGRRVAVLAVDPTSPFSGGAILGDRIRMTRWHQDRHVFIRSMATRGHLGGLASTTLQVLVLLDAFGFDDIFIETVGVGQSEVDIVQVADTTLLVLTPGQGDAVQAFKAGIMEIADIFVINKFDLPGGERLRREIRAVLELGAMGAWLPPIVQCIASRDEGSKTLFETLQSHYRHLEDDTLLVQKRRNRVRFEITSLLNREILATMSRQEDAIIEAVEQGAMSVQQAVSQLISGQI